MPLPVDRIPPEPRAAGPSSFNWVSIVADALGAFLPLEPVRAWIQKTAEETQPGVTAAALLMQIETRADFLIKLAEAWAIAKLQVSEKLGILAAYGISELFGFQPNPNALTGPGGAAERKAMVETIGGQLLGALFSQVDHGGAPTDAEGWHNAVRMVDTSVKLALEGWLTKNVGLGFITKELPDVGDLDSLMAQSLGMGRMTTRGLRTVVDVLVAEPARRFLLSAYTPNVPTETQLLKLLNRGRLDEGEYFREMARLGWSRDYAADFRALNAVRASRADVARWFQAGLVDRAYVESAYIAQGFTKEDAARMATSIAEDRLDDFERAAVTEALSQFVDRVLDEPELRAIADLARYTSAEKDAIVALGQLRRARPKELTAAQRQGGFEEGLLDADELQLAFERDGYTPAAVGVLMGLAVAKKARADLAKARDAARRAPGVPAPLARSVYEELFRRGLLEVNALLAGYRALGIPSEQQAVLQRLAEARRADYLRAIQQRQEPPKAITSRPGAVEAAYVRGLVTRDELIEFYTSEGFSGDGLELLVKLRDAELADAAAARERARIRLEGTGTSGGN